MADLAPRGNAPPVPWTTSSAKPRARLPADRLGAGCVSLAHAAALPAPSAALPAILLNQLPSSSPPRAQCACRPGLRGAGACRGILRGAGLLGLGTSWLPAGRPTHAARSTVLTRHAVPSTRAGVDPGRCRRLQSGCPPGGSCGTPAGCGAPARLPQLRTRSANCSHRPWGPTPPRYRMRSLSRRRSGLLLLALAPLIAGVSIVYDEMRWTKADVSLYKVEFDPMRSFNPSSELALPSALQHALSKSTHNSLDGPSPQREASSTPGWARRGVARIERHAVPLAACCPPPPPPPQSEPGSRCPCPSSRWPQAARAALACMRAGSGMRTAMRRPLMIRRPLTTQPAPFSAQCATVRPLWQRAAHPAPTHPQNQQRQQPARPHTRPCQQRAAWQPARAAAAGAPLGRRAGWETTFSPPPPPHPAAARSPPASHLARLRAHHPRP